MNLGIYTDFRDFYDHWFAGSWQEPAAIFDRRARHGMSRGDMLVWLQDLGFKVPRFGKVRNLAPVILQEFLCGRGKLSDLVVHFDEAAHAGKGKELLSCCDALARFPEAFATEYIQATRNGAVVSLRYLQIGRRRFWLRYSSSDWRSNCGDVRIEFLGEEKILDFCKWIRHPLFALDFLESGGELLALDFNTAPRIQGTGVEDIMHGKEVYRELSRFFL